MRLRGREINIFSMSALDLFASGMGAFILLAIMALPFFPNTSSSPVPPESGEEPDEIVRQELDEALETARQERDEARQRAEALAEALEQATQERDRSLQEAEDLQSRVAELEVPDFDLVICLDVSGSMTEQVDGLKLQINNLARILNAIAPTGLGIVAFGDRDWDVPIFVQDVTTNMGALENFVNGLAPNMGLGLGGNDDNEEALAMALERAVAMNWRSVSERRYVVVISDYAAYPERQAAALRTAQDFSAGEDRHVSAVMVNGRGTGRAPETFMRRLVAAGDGEFVDGDEKTLIGSILLAVLLS